MGDLIDQLFQVLQQLILPNWSDLIGLLPWVIIALVIVSMIFLAYYWRKSAARNRSRVPKPLAGGAPPPGVHLPGPSRWPFVAPIGAALLLFAFALPPKDAAGNTTGPINVQLLIIGLIVTLIAIAGWLWDAMREWRAADHPGDAHAVALPAGASVAMALSPGAIATPRGRPGAFGAAVLEVVEEPSAPEPPPGVHLPGPSPWPFFVPIGATLMLYGLIFSAILIVGGLILTIIAIAGWYRDAGRELATTEEFGHAVPKTRDPQKAWPRRLVRVFIWVIAVSLVLTLIPSGLNALNSLTPPKATAAPIVVPAVPVIAAQALAFNTRNLVVPAGRPFDLTFDNNDAGVPHNVRIDTADKSAVLFDGEITTGILSTTYHVDPLQAGSYYFLCKVHPNMNGTVTAAPETGAPTGAPPGAPPSGSASQAP